MDHWFQMEAFAASQDPMLEGYTTLGFLAGQTETLTLSLLVTGVTYRRPGLLAKTVTTLDVLSQGRALFGIGAAWYEREHRGLGVDFPPVSERFERLEETLQICHQMWSDDDGPYRGTATTSWPRPSVRPRPLQRPRPPILVGALVSARPCAWWPATPTPAISSRWAGPGRHKLEVLDRHCDAEGGIRPTSEDDPRGGDPIDIIDGFMAEMEQFANLGIDLVS